MVVCHSSTRRLVSPSLYCQRREGTEFMRSPSTLQSCLYFPGSLCVPEVSSLFQPLSVHSWPGKAGQSGCFRWASKRAGKPSQHSHPLLGVPGAAAVPTAAEQAHPLRAKEVLSRTVRIYHPATRWVNFPTHRHRPAQTPTVTCHSGPFPSGPG